MAMSITVSLGEVPIGLLTYDETRRRWVTERGGQVFAFRSLDDAHEAIRMAQHVEDNRP